MIKVAVCGACGHMGKIIRELLKDDNEACALCGVDPYGESADITLYKSFVEMAQRPDVIIDFSSPAALSEELKYCTEHGVPAVIGSTGFTKDQLEEIDEAARRVAIFRTANFSLGVNLLCKLVREAAAVLGKSFDVEIVEKHHNNKKDAPSGTALMLADSANEGLGGGREYMYGREGNCGKRGNEIGLHAVRGGTIVGEHEVMFCGEDEIVTLSHSAHSKKVFAAGAIKAAKWISNRPAGLYSMDDILKF